MRYLMGDSSESNLDFNYLAFLREVIDCAAVLAEAEVTLASNVDYGRTREKETAAVVAAVEDLGKRATQLVGPVAKEQGATPVGRCAALIANAVREAVEKESSQARATLATAREEMSKEDQRLHARTREVLGKLLRAHDLPGAEKELEVVWTGSAVKAMMRQRTGFGVEALISLEIPAGSIFAPDLRVDRIAEAVEVHALEAGGWLKKSDKLVPHKLGRYQVIRVSVGTTTLVRLRSGTDVAAVFDLKVRNGAIAIDRTSGGPSDFTIDDKDRPALKLLVDRLEAATRLLETRSGLMSIEIDGKLLAEHGHPRVLAERLVTAIAPTVQKIARHSRSPGELVLRRLLADDRREEVFISTGELLKRFDALPAPAREIFAALGLGGEHPRAEVKSPPAAADVKPEVRPAGGTSPPPMALIPPGAPRNAASRTSPPPITGERPVVPAPAPKPTRPPPVSEPVASPPADTTPKPTRLPAAVIVDKPDSPEAEEPRRKRPDSKSLPTVVVSSDDDGTPPAK
jgi:hypothetical protein